MGWVLSKIMGVKLVSDDYFIFTEGLSNNDLYTLENWIEKLKKDSEFDIELMCDSLFVWSAIIELEPSLFASYREKFEATATKVLKQSDEKKIMKNKFTLFTFGASSPSFTNEAASALSDYAKLYPIDEWNWYVISGTFLGLIREKKILEHDCDLDFGINAEDFEENKFIEKLNGSPDFTIVQKDIQKKYKLNEQKIESVEKYLALIKVVHRSGVNIDVFVHHLENGVRWHGSSYHRWDNKEFSVSQYSLEGVAVNGPTDSNNYLTENYGDWRTPVVNFNSTSGTPNLRLVKTPSSIALNIKRIAMIQECSIAERSRLLLKRENLITDSDEFHFSEL